MAGNGFSDISGLEGQRQRYKPVRGQLGNSFRRSHRRYLIDVETVHPGLDPVSQSVSQSVSNHLRVLPPLTETERVCASKVPASTISFPIPKKSEKVSGDVCSLPDMSVEGASRCVFTRLQLDESSFLDKGATDMSAKDHGCVVQFPPISHSLVGQDQVSPSFSSSVFDVTPLDPPPRYEEIFSFNQHEISPANVSEFEASWTLSLAKRQEWFDSEVERYKSHGKNLLHSQVSFDGYNLEGVNLSGLSTLSFLKDVSFVGCNILELSRDMFVGLKHVSTINLNRNSLDVVCLSDFSGLKKLKILSLAECGISNLTVDVRGGIPNLEQLNCSRNCLDDFSVACARRLPKLSILSLASNNFREIPSEALNACPQLYALDLSDNWLQIFVCPSRASNLSYIHLVDNPLQFCSVNRELLSAETRQAFPTIGRNRRQRLASRVSSLPLRSIPFIKQNLTSKQLGKSYP